MILKTTNGIPYTVTVSRSGVTLKLYAQIGKDTNYDVDKAKLSLKHCKEGIAIITNWSKNGMLPVSKITKRKRDRNYEKEVRNWMITIEILKEEIEKLKNQLEIKTESQIPSIDNSFECQTCGGKTLCNDKGETIEL